MRHTSVQELIRDTNRLKLQGNYAKARNCLCLALKDYAGPDRHHILAELGGLYLIAHDHALAAKHYCEALDCGCDCPSDVCITIGLCFYQLCEHEKALEFLARAIDPYNHSHPGDVYFHMAAAHREFGRHNGSSHHYEQALSCYRQAERSLRLVQDWDIENSRGYLHMTFGQWQEAEKCFLSALEHEDCYAVHNVYHNLGCTYLELGDVAQARLHFAQGARSQQSDTDAASNLGLARVCERAFDFTQALAYYERAREGYQKAESDGCTSATYARKHIAEIDERIDALRQRLLQRCPRTGGACSKAPIHPAAKHVFVAMPFGREHEAGYWTGVFDGGIKPAIDANGLEAIRVDRDQGNAGHSIMCNICEHIQQARLVIADITGGNPNVLYEVGLAHALEKQVILIAQKDTELPFDVRELHCLGYYDVGHCKLALADFMADVLGPACHVPASQAPGWRM